MSCNSYAFDTECTKETRSLLLVSLLCLSLSLSGFKLITINLLVTNSGLAKSLKSTQSFRLLWKKLM